MFKSSISPELQELLDERTPDKLAAAKRVHTNATALLAASSVYSGHAAFLVAANVPMEHIPVKTCGPEYYYNQVPRLLADCLPFARRGPINVFAQAGASASREAEEMRIALALGAAGFLVLFQVPEASGIAAALPLSFVLVAPNVIVRRSSPAYTLATGTLRSTEPFAAPFLLLGDPAAGMQSHVDLDALKEEQVKTMLYAWPDADEEALAFQRALLCSAGLGLAFAHDWHTADDLASRTSHCAMPVVTVRSSLAGLTGPDAFAAQLAALLAPERSGIFDNSGRAAADAANKANISVASLSQIPGAVHRCLDTQSAVWSSFLVACLPGRRGLYVQEATVSFTTKLYQRPQHMSKAMARMNMLAVYVQTGRALGSLRRSAVHRNVFLADEELRKMVTVMGAVVNVHSTMLWLSPDALRGLAEAGNAVVYEYIDAIDEAISGPYVKQLNALRAQAIQSATLVVYSAHNLMQGISLEQRPSSSYAYVPNGVDLAMYPQAPTGKQALRSKVQVPETIRHIVDKNKPIVGYFGAIAPWIWMEVVLDAAKLMPDVEFLLIGPAYGDVEIPDAEGLPENLHFHPPVAASDLVLFGRHFTVGFIPFRMGEIAKTTSPLKLFEYFALGLPTVVTSDMVECTRFDVVRAASSAAEYASQLRLALSEAKDGSLSSRLLELARANSWDSRAQVTLSSLSAIM